MTATIREFPVNLAEKWLHVRLEAHRARKAAAAFRKVLKRNRVEVEEKNAREAEKLLQQIEAAMETSPEPSFRLYGSDWSIEKVQ